MEDIKEKEPRYFARMMKLDRDNRIEMVPARLQITAKSFRWRAVTGWNGLPENLRSCLSLQSFKSQIKQWLIDREKEKEEEEMRRKLTNN